MIKNYQYNNVVINEYTTYNPHHRKHLSDEEHSSINDQQFAKHSQKLNQKELTLLELEALYWKLLAPLNYKILEGKYILVCPVCDADLGSSRDKMMYENHFRLEELWGKKQRQSHDKECEAIAEA